MVMSTVKFVVDVLFLGPLKRGSAAKSCREAPRKLGKQHRPTTPPITRPKKPRSVPYETDLIGQSSPAAPLHPTNAARLSDLSCTYIPTASMYGRRAGIKLPGTVLRTASTGHAVPASNLGDWDRRHRFLADHSSQRWQNHHTEPAEMPSSGMMANRGDKYGVARGSHDIATSR